MPKKTRAHYTANGHRREDPDVARIAREELTREKAAGDGRGQMAHTPVSDEVPDAIRSGEEIPETPKATSIPGHEPRAQESRPREQSHARTRRGPIQDGVDQREARRHQPTPPAEAMPSSREARRGLPSALLSGVMAAPVAAVRLAGHLTSRASRAISRLAGPYRARGERVVQDWRSRLSAKKA